MSAERVAWLRDRRVRLGETHLGRAAVLRAPVHVEDVQQDPALNDAGSVLRGIHAVLAVPLLRDDKVVGGLVIRRRTAGGFAPEHPDPAADLRWTGGARDRECGVVPGSAGRARTAAENALADLRRAQDRLVQSEKMASLGQLTAGIAHEIKNPLNFVNNFAESVRRSAGRAARRGGAGNADRQLRAEIDELTTTLKGNLEKIAEHGRRADSIVKNMLLHSRTGPERAPRDRSERDRRGGAEPRLSRRAGGDAGVQHHDGEAARSAGRHGRAVSAGIHPRDAEPDRQWLLRRPQRASNRGCQRLRADAATDHARPGRAGGDPRARQRHRNQRGRARTRSSSRSSPPSRPAKVPGLASRSATISSSNSTGDN